MAIASGNLAGVQLLLTSSVFVCLVSSCSRLTECKQQLNSSTRTPSAPIVPYNGHTHTHTHAQQAVEQRVQFGSAFSCLLPLQFMREQQIHPSVLSVCLSISLRLTLSLHQQQLQLFDCPTVLHPQKSLRN